MLFFLNNSHDITVTLLPDGELENRRLTSVKNKLSDILATMTSAEVDELVAKRVELRDEQLRPDSPEALATIPKLSLTDVGKEAEKYPFQFDQSGKSRVSITELDTNGIGPTRRYEDPGRRQFHRASASLRRGRSFPTAPHRVRPRPRLSLRAMTRPRAALT